MTATGITWAILSPCPTTRTSYLVPTPCNDLELILKAIKGAAARNCNLPLGSHSQYWQPDSYDHIVRTLEQLVVFREYIADNPKKAGIVLPPKASYHPELDGQVALVERKSFRS